MRQCPICTHQYTVDAIAVLEEREGMHLVHITCPSCSNAVLAVVVVSAIGMSSVGVVTDLDVQDVVRLRNRPIFSQDDVLDFYTCIESRGTFEQAVMNHAAQLSNIATQKRSP